MVTAVSANLLLQERRTLVDGREVHGMSAYRYAHTGTHSSAPHTHYVCIIFDRLRQTRLNPVQISRQVCEGTLGCTEKLWKGNDFTDKQEGNETSRCDLYE